MKKERLPKKQYFQLRLTQAIESGNTKKANYYRGRLAEMNKEANTDLTQEQSATLKCQKRFEGLTESERIIEANKFINHSIKGGISINASMAFLKKANVMSDTELMQATQF